MFLLETLGARLMMKKILTFPLNRVINLKIIIKINQISKFDVYENKEISNTIIVNTVDKTEDNWIKNKLGQEPASIEVRSSLR